MPSRSGLRRALAVDGSDTGPPRDDGLRGVLPGLYRSQPPLRPSGPAASSRAQEGQGRRRNATPTQAIAHSVLAKVPRMKRSAAAGALSSENLPSPLTARTTASPSGQPASSVPATAARSSRPIHTPPRRISGSCGPPTIPAADGSAARRTAAATGPPPATAARTATSEAPRTTAAGAPPAAPAPAAGAAGRPA